MDKQKLLRVATYARMNNISVQTVYDRIKNEKVKIEKIDGVIFVKDE